MGVRRLLFARTRYSAGGSGADVACIVHVAREFDGFAGAGGVREVSQSLAVCAAQHGIDAHVVIPHYWTVDDALHVRRSSGLSAYAEVEAKFNIPLNYPSGDRSIAVTVRR